MSSFFIFTPPPFTPARQAGEQGGINAKLVDQRKILVFNKNNVHLKANLPVEKYESLDKIQRRRRNTSDKDICKNGTFV